MTVLFLLDDPRLTEAIRQRDWQGVSASSTKRCDVAVARAGEFPELPKSVGRLAIGEDPVADVSLAEDFTPREFQLACRLLGQIVRLRRARRKSRRLQRALAAQAQTDPLTGLPNRRAWDELLAPRIAAAREAEQGVVLALFDVDHFKAVNTQYGLPIGDRVLRRVGQSLTGGVRGGDFVARLGGDEFGLLLTGVADHNAADIVERLRARIAADPAEPGLPAVTVSVGLAGGSSRSSRELFAAADEALRQAKAAGRNRAVQAPLSP